jgi:hypothetical protein
MKNFATLIALLLFTSMVKGQSYQLCQLIEPSANTARLSSSNNNISSSILTKSIPVCIRIKFHIIRNSDQTGGYDPNNLYQIIDVANNAFSQHGIYFKSDGYDFIDNSSLYINPTYSLILNSNSPYHVTDAINYYLFESSNANGGAAGRGSNFCAVPNSDALSSTTPHELGHCLNLRHTHDTYNGVEQLDGSNCQNLGDTFCDTPADPNLFDAGNYDVDQNCTYTGGGGYNPDTFNFMSYSRPHCRTSFTDNQVTEMTSNGINGSAILPTIDQSPYVWGAGSICPFETETYTFNFCQNPDSWVLTPNLTEVSRSGNQITVRKTNNNTVQNGQVSAILNDISIDWAVDLIVTPNVGSGIGGTSNQVYLNSSDQLSVNGSLVADYYEWSVLDDYNSCSSNEPYFPYNGGTSFATTTSPSVWLTYGSCTGTFRIRCRAVNSCGYDYYSDREVEVVGGPCSEFSVYPNPAKKSKTKKITAKIIVPCQNFTTFSSEPEVNYMLFDIAGNPIYERKNGKMEETISIEKLPKGIYYLHATPTGESKHVSRIYIND